MVIMKIYKLSKETREKMSKARMGNKNTLGHVLSTEHRKKLSMALKGKRTGKDHPMFGKHHTDEHRAHMKRIMTGRARSVEHRRRLSEALKGKTVPTDVREKIRNTLLGRKLPTSHRKNMSLSQRGPKSHLYKDGLSHLRKTERQRLMQTIEYRLWRESVFRRDDHTCVFCGARGRKLNADHIKRWADYPLLRFAIDNGRTLCVPCHEKTDTYGR